MNQIDWKLTDIPELLISRTSEIREVYLRITDDGDKNWLQGPLGTSESEHMEQIFPESQRDINRAVFGYYAWGYCINVLQDRWAWTKAEHINWKEQILVPSIVTPAIRIWLHPGVHAKALVQTYDPRVVQQGVIKDPAGNVIWPPWHGSVPAPPP